MTVGGKRLKVSLVLAAVVLLGTVGYVGFRLFSPDEPAHTDSRNVRVPYSRPPTVVVPPVVPGWQSVAGRDGSYAYDVPPDWTPKPETMRNWKADGRGPVLRLARPAYHGKGYCESDRDRPRGGTGVATSKAPDPSVKIATELAKHVYGDAKLTVEPSQETQISFEHGKTRPGIITMIEVTPEPGDCEPAKAYVGAISIASGENGNPKCAVMAVYSDDTMSRDQVLQILKSYRWVPPANRTTTVPPR
ncbi:hypothetical protein AB5J62_30165 [Amycolatopsis sp. cg5]|uniref:hypothetical protein n=1 Tax=Amycolatopsis sp. cg5 TaxID=3238802 RepID=UPI0035247290